MLLSCSLTFTRTDSANGVNEELAIQRGGESEWLSPNVTSHAGAGYTLRLMTSDERKAVERAQAALDMLTPAAARDDANRV
jgi:hypothetical protein